jgi:transcriptional regulator with XRE-family HTH domain
MRRMMLGMTQAQLGDPLGVTFQRVQKYEKGRNRIVAARLQQIADVLDVPVAFFFEGTSAKTGNLPAENPLGLLATSAGLRLASAFPRIADAKLRRRIVDLIEELAGPAE